MSRTYHIRHRQSGNAMVEFALGFTLLWFLFSGVFQFAYSIYIYENLMNAVSDAAFFAARADFNASSTNTFVTQVQNMAVYGSPAGGGTALAPSLTASKVSVTWTSDSAGVTQTVTVGITNYSISALFQTITLTNKPRCTVKYAGTFMT